MALKVVRRSIKQIRDNPNNPRVHATEQIELLKRSITEWGFTLPILVDEQGVILAGHGRLEAAKQLQMDAVPVVIARGWTDEQKRAYLIADNKIAMNGKWDMDLLKKELEAICEADNQFQSNLLGATGYEKCDLDKLIETAAKTDSEPVRKLEMRIEKWAVECTEEERDALVERFNEYSQERGLKAGFIGFLCRKANKRLSGL